MSKYNTLYDFDSSWKATQVVIDRPLGDVRLTLSVTFAREGESKTLEFINPDDPENIIELIDFMEVVVLEETGVERDFGTIKVEFLGEVYAELWCDAVSLKQSA